MIYIPKSASGDFIWVIFCYCVLLNVTKFLPPPSVLGVSHIRNYSHYFAYVARIMEFAPLNTDQPFLFTNYFLGDWNK